MNTHKLTREEIEKNFQGLKNLGELIEAVQINLNVKGEVVCQFTVNNLKLFENDEEKFKGMPISEINDLCIDSERPDRLLVTVLENWSVELPKLIVKVDQLSQNLKLSGADGQYTLFVNIIDHCQFLVESLISLDSLCHQLELFDLNAWQTNKVKLTDAVREALLAFEKKDLVLLADVLEYELGDSLQCWVDMLNQLLTSVKNEVIKDDSRFKNFLRS